MTMIAGCDSYTQLLLLHRICIHAEPAISGSVPNQEFCFPKAAGKTGGILDSKTASETISKHLIFKKISKMFPWEGGGGGGGSMLPDPPTFCVSLLFYSPDLCPPPNQKKSSYVYANYNLTQAIQCYQKNCKGVQNFVYDPYMLVLTEKNWTT